MVCACQVIKSLRDAGFEVLEYRDLAPESEIPWYDPFEPKLTLKGFKTTPLGIKLTNISVKIMEVRGAGRGVVGAAVSSLARLLDCACRRLPSRLDADCAACVCNGVWAGGWLQFLRLAPAGSSEMHNNLTTGAITLYQGGSQNIFTPMYFFVARKPATAAASGRK